MIAILLWLLAGGVYIWSLSETEIAYDIVKYHIDKNKDEKKKQNNVIFLKYYNKFTFTKFHKWKWLGVIAHRIGINFMMTIVWSYKCKDDHLCCLTRNIRGHYDIRLRNQANATCTCLVLGSSMGKS